MPSVMSNTRWYRGMAAPLWLLVLLMLGVPATAAPMCYADVRLAYAALNAQHTEQHTVAASKSININRASEAELTTLQGIGSSKARAIILYREMFGGFAVPEDITNVKGIGEATFRKNQARIRVTD